MGAGFVPHIHSRPRTVWLADIEYSSILANEPSQGRTTRLGSPHPFEPCRRLLQAGSVVYRSRFSSRFLLFS